MKVTTVHLNENAKPVVFPGDNVSWEVSEESTLTLWDGEEQVAEFSMHAWRYVIKMDGPTTVTATALSASKM